MSIGQKLSQLRRDKHLSQEEVADKVGVSRQTISKWETDQSLPDFDKILPLCELYGISANELLGYEKDNILIKETKCNNTYPSKKKALGISLGVLLYFVAVVFIMIAITYCKIDPVVSSGIFLLICGIATFIIIYVSMVYGKKEEKIKKEKNPIFESINGIISVIFTIIYLTVSFITFAWHITWIIWVIYALVSEIVKLLFLLGGNKYEE